MRRRCFGLALVASAALPARAAEPGTAAAFVQDVGRELPGVVGGAASEADKRRVLVPFLGRVVDMDALSRFCLGRYWRLASPAQQAEYRALLLDVLAGAVASRVGAYGADAGHGQGAITVLPELAKPDGAYVPTIVRTPGQPPVHVTWVVNTSVRPFRILDVQAEGLSMRLALRSDHTLFLGQHDGDIGLFLRTLRERTR